MHMPNSAQVRNSVVVSHVDVVRDEVVLALVLKDVIDLLGAGAANVRAKLNVVARHSVHGGLVEFAVKPFTKPPLFQRNRLTGSGNPTFESCVEVKAQQR